MVKELKLDFIKKKLINFDKIVVTGPPRSGTTISGYIIANILDYIFIDETNYKYDSKEFIKILLTVRNKIVIHNVVNSKNLYILNDYFNTNNIAVVLIKRDIEDIRESYLNLKNLDVYSNIISKVNDEVIDKNYKNFLYARDIYDWFDANIIDNLFELNYEDLREHELFIIKDERRKYFKHIKQISFDPYKIMKSIHYA